MLLAQDTIINMPAGTLMTVIIVSFVLAGMQILGIVKNRRLYECIVEIHQRSAGCAEMQSRIGELHVSHLGPQALDEDGAPKWYGRKSTEVSVIRLADIIDKFGDQMTATMASLDKTLNAMHVEMRDVRKRLEAIEVNSKKV